MFCLLIGISLTTASVLVLGMCFFAGGMRFSEQGFGQSTCIVVPKREPLILTFVDRRCAAEFVTAYH
jgi:hypothetical protein